MNRKLKLISIISFISIIVLTLSIIGIVNLNKNKPHSHKLSKIEANNATCTEDGNIEYYKCDCGLCFTDSNGTYEIQLEDTIINKTGHHCSVVDEHEASCIEDSIITVKCDECSYEYTDCVHAVGHAFSAWTVTKEKTCNEPGEESRVCELCNYTETRSTIKSEHDYVLVQIYNVDNIELSKYECSYCNALTYTEGEKEPDPVVEVKEDLFDCSTDFSFVVYCEENEDYIKQNLKIYDAYFENTEYINNSEIKIEYTVSPVEENYWLIKPINSYLEGTTYKIEANEKITLQENNLDNLYFTTEATDIVELNGNDDEVIFIKNLEEQYGGYLPYSVNDLDDSEYIYVELGSKNNINVGDTICVGDISSIAELLTTTNDCYLGEVKEIFANKNGNYTLALTAPNMDKIFNNINLIANESINIDNEDLSPSLKDDICNALYNDSEFISLIASMDETANEYATTRKLTSQRVNLENFFNNVKLTPAVKFEQGKLYTSIDGTFSLNLYSKVNDDTKVIGSIALQFKIEMEAGFDISINYKLKKFAGIPYGVNYFDVSLTQTNAFGFDFNISINMNSDYELGYIKDISKNTIHFSDCKKAKKLLEDTNSYTVLSNEDAYYEYIHSTKVCKTCDPFNNVNNPAYIIDKENHEIHSPSCEHAKSITRTNLIVKLDKLNNILKDNSLSRCTVCNVEDPAEKSFKDKVIDKLQSCDWESVINKVKSCFDKTQKKEDGKEENKEDTSKKDEVDHTRIKLVEAAAQITIFSINFDLYLTLDFDIKASLSYKYKVESKTVSGIRLQKDDTHTYKTVEKTVLNNELNIVGDVSLEIGLDAEVYLTFVGLAKYIQAGFSVEAGIYSDLSGILHYDGVNKDESYYAAYLEAGINLDINLYYKLFKWYGEFTIYENKFKLLELGYDKVYYDYDNYIDEIIIDTKIDVNDYNLLNVNYYDMNDNMFGVDVLTLDSNYYTISFELEKGEYLYIDGTSIYTIKDAPSYFEDKLIINVTSNNKWNKYVKGSVAEFLEAYEVSIIHDKTFNILLDNMGIGNEAVVEAKYAVIPSTLPILSAEGYTFAGWYYDQELTLPAVSGDAIISNVTLYAKWLVNLLADNYSFINRSVVYDGNPHSIYVAGDLPSGVTIEYTNNENINAGEYIVTAHFVDSTSTYALPSDMSAVLTINKAEYDMSDISFDDYYTVFDSTVKSVEISGNIPQELKISYINNGQIEAGAYLVTASFISTNKNYNNPKNMTANLVIEKAKYDMSNIIFEDMEVVYNGSIQRIEIVGELDSFIEVEYLNNENINAGIYEVTAVFTSTSNNYLSPENMVANLTINKATYDMSNIVFDNKNVVYTGEAHRVEITGELNDYLSVSYTNNNKANVGEYEVIATFINNNDNYYTPSPIKAILDISKATYDMSNIIFKDKAVTYNGSQQSIHIIGDLPAGVSVSYENNDKINVGEYEVIAKFENSNTNYNDIENISATLTINKANYDMSSISFKDEIVIYDGNSHSLAISGDLPIGVSVSYENNNKITVGEYSVVAKFTNINDNYNTPEDMTAKLTITKIENALDNVKFENKTVVYNGLAQSIYINAELPEGLTVEYTNNAKTNVGEYEVIAHFVDEKGIYSLPEDMKATLTIIKADYDMSDVKFENKTVVYNGSSQSIYISGALPTGLSVTYENNDNINVGTYDITAIFKTTNPNYNTPNNLAAQLTITKADYDMSNVKFENKTVIYNKGIQALAISGSLPENVSVSYENNSNINVGTYEVIAVFSTADSNYNAPASMIATLKINKASYDMSGITFTGKSVVYNGASQSIYISGTLPTGLSVSYTNNGKIEVGEYTITAKFSTSNSNYYIPSSITARLAITKADYDMSGITFTNKSVVYNGSSQSIYISGALPTGLSVSYTGNSKVNVGVYDITATFTNTNTNYNTPASKTAKLTITKADYDMSGITFTGKSVVYNGASQSIYISGTLPTGLSVSYTGNSNVNAGEYTVTAKFSNTNSNYNTPASKTAKLTITKANYDMSNVKFYDLTKVYNGSTIYNNIIGSLPNGVSVTYVNNGQTEIGVYNITANFTTTSSNYNTPASRSAVLRIVDEIIIDSFKYDYLSGDLTASLVGYTDSLDGDITIPSAISYLSKSYTVTKIEDKAFKDCSSIDAVTLNDGLIEIGEYAFSGASLSEISLSPSTLEVIGEYAFKGCEELTTVYVGNLKLIDYYAFGNCSNLKNIFFMNSDWDIEIGSYAFINCTSLTSIFIPYYVASIGNDAFYGCSNLTSVAFEDGISSIGSYAFSQTGIKEFKAPASLASLGAYAFYDCTSLSKVTLNSGLVSIGSSAFSSCTGLTEVVIPGSIKNIPSSCFLECFALQKVDIQNGILSIGSSAFRSCYSLQYLYFPSTLLTIYESAFEGCSSIEELILPDGVTSLQASAFKDCDGISIIGLGASLTSIGESAFEGCLSLVVVQIPSKVVSIGARAFYGCIGLISITLPNSLTNIGHSCFYNCTKLETIEIPSSVTTVYSTTFTNCAKLNNIIMHNVTEIEFSAFTGCSSLTTIYYGRTIDDWNNLKLGSYNQNLLSCDVYYYSSSKPTDTTNKYWYYNNNVITHW